MKHCPYCRHEIQRWGKTAAGTVRFFCSSCKRTITKRARTSYSERHLRYELDLWLDGQDNFSDIAKRYQPTRQTFWKHFRPIFSFPFEPSIPKEPMHTLILD